MRVRVIAGMYGGRRLDTPPGRGTHPMGERIRNALCNSIQAELPGATVLDAFAGTGALGIESLSRGAASVTFVEKGRTAQKVIASNLLALGIDESRARLFRARVSSFIAAHPDAQFDIIFVDPPYYEINQHLSTVERLFTLLKPGGLMVLSKPGKCEELVAGDEIVVVDNRSYSNATLTFYRRKA